MGRPGRGADSRPAGPGRPVDGRRRHSRWRPGLEVVVNAAAYNLVDRAETEPSTAMEVNALGPRRLARCCASRGSPPGPRQFRFRLRCRHVACVRLTPSRTRPGPLGAYAVSKLGGELYVRSGCPDHLVVRTCGLYGHAASRRETGGNFVETMLRLAPEDGPVRVVDDQRCTPTSTVVLAAAIDALLESGCDRSLPRHLFRWQHHVVRVCPRDLRTGPGWRSRSRRSRRPSSVRRRQRPGYSVLDCGRLIRDTGYTPPDWQLTHWPSTWRLERTTGE